MSGSNKDNHGSSSSSSSPFASFIRKFRCDQPHYSQDSTIKNIEVEAFQKQVTEHFQELLSTTSDELLSIGWIKKLLDTFMSCLEEFRVILLNNKADLSKPPLERFASEFFERTVKGLDICNASRDGIEKIKLWRKHLEIVLSALDPNQRALGEAQFRRARKGLVDLTLAMLEEKDTGPSFSQRNRSFGRHNTGKAPTRSPGHSRSLSWSVSRSWSAAKQLQSISNNLNPPRGSDIAATNGFAMTIFTMSFVLLFVLFALVAALPCQDRGLNVPFSVPRQSSWAVPLLSLHAKIMEESKKRERRNSNGLLKEIYQIEKCSRAITNVIESAQRPLTDEVKTEINQVVVELGQVCEAFKVGLDPLERQVRGMFQKIMNCRTEALDSAKAKKPE